MIGHNRRVMKRVLVIANNPNQASFRLRIEALVQPLSARGVALEVQFRPRARAARRKLLASAAGYDATILQRKLLDPPDARLLAQSAKRVLFDVDDAVMYDHPGAGWLARRRAWRRFLATARNVDHVVAGNEHLAQMFRRHGASASVLPTVVDVDRYPVKAHGPAPTVTLAWIGSQSTLPYLAQIMPALSKAGRMRLLVVADATLPSVAGVEVELVPWSIQAESTALARADIGIAPTPLDRWTAGKCGFKIVQYMAAGLPTIASPVGANSELVVENETGLLPRRAEDWPAAVAKLAQDADLRARMGAAARARAVNEYSLQRAVDFWDRLLHES